jgi:ferredoxin-NADP reductase
MKTEIIFNEIGRGTTRILLVQGLGWKIEPGSGAELTIDGITRPFSFCNSPDSMIRDVPDGEFGSRIAKLTDGDEIDLAGYFHFFRVGGIATEENPIYVFTTGVGIAPFLCGLQARTFKPTKIFYGAKTCADLTNRDCLKGIDIVRFTSREEVPHARHGRIDAAVTPDIIDPNARYFLCGLTDMVTSVSNALVEQGVAYDQISSELFYMKS